MTQLIHSRSILTASAAVLCAFLVPTAHADVFGSGANTLTLEFVTIGNAGNTDDRGAGGGLYSTPYGGVSYGYRMGTYEISQDAITKATAGGLANVVTGPHTGNEPAANMSWFQAAAFVNWLNDQRTPGLKAYDVAGNSMTLWASVDAWQAGGENLYRHKDAYYFLPSEDEWYKAAYHQNTGVNADYWDYATGSNSAPIQALTDGTLAGSAVYNGVEAGFPADPADVNLAGGLSAYGTMGQNGNVFEWQESAFDGINNWEFDNRAIRGSSWLGGVVYLRSSGSDYIPPILSNFDIGFRVASVPEPSSTVLMISAGLLAIARRRRRAAL
ncbi:MAG: SUMF1/EgtB/PvdO family nonheme iron enzyme [Verrucomicrobia bacterium]|nr:MAG: SUMF1/EgtB/PvdO family nonheme iron enzyme [Verrucomicrobiota bacterium]